MTYRIVAQRPQDAALIPGLLDRTFGPDRADRIVHRLREDLPPIADLCFSAVDEDGGLLGSLRFWPIVIGEDHGDPAPAILLGPLAVEPVLQGRGIGKALIGHGLAHARLLGHRLCVVVGDPPYYRPFGFASAPEAGLLLPGPADPRRFQVLELVPDALGTVRGVIGRGVIGRGSDGRRPLRGRDAPGA